MGVCCILPIKGFKCCYRGDQTRSDGVMVVLCGGVCGVVVWDGGVR